MRTANITAKDLNTKLFNLCFELRTFSSQIQGHIDYDVMMEFVDIVNAIVKN